MAQAENVAIARKFHEAWTERDPEGGAALLAEDCEFYDMARGDLLGPAGYKRDYERWLAAFPDGECEITHVIDGGEWVVVEFTTWFGWCVLRGRRCACASRAWRLPPERAPRKGNERGLFEPMQPRTSPR